MMINLLTLVAPSALCVAELPMQEDASKIYQCPQNYVSAKADAEGVFIRPSDEDYHAGYAMMNIINKQGDQYLAVLTDNGGGTGVFSSIVSFTFRAPNQYKLGFTAAGGDRCTGGNLDEVKWVDNDRLEFSTSITPYSLFSRPSYGENPSNAAIDAFVNENQAFKFWAIGYSSAVSCVARIVQQYQPSTNTTHTSAIQIDIKGMQQNYPADRWQCLSNWLSEDALKERRIDAKQWYQLLETLPKSCP